MLKIKDNVDLKELEKFGFKEDYNMYFYKNKYDIKVVEINKETRKIDNLGDITGNIIFYDLIKADLVEKGGGIFENDHN